MKTKTVTAQKLQKTWPGRWDSAVLRRRNGRCSTHSLRDSGRSSVMES